MSSASSSQLTVTVNDNGNWGQTRSFTPPSQVLLINILGTTGSNIGNKAAVTAAITASILGGTTVIGASLYGLYIFIRRKSNLLPQEYDPWENEEGFDATLDNPLYRGSSEPKVALDTE